MCPNCLRIRSILKELLEKLKCEREPRIHSGRVTFPEGTAIVIMAKLREALKEASYVMEVA